MNVPERPLIWMGSSRKDLRKLPVRVRRFFGHTLHFTQCGDRHEAAKPLKGFGGAGFQKKSKRGIATPKDDMNNPRQAEGR